MAGNVQRKSRWRQWCHHQYLVTNTVPPGEAGGDQAIMGSCVCCVRDFLSWLRALIGARARLCPRILIQDIWTVSSTNWKDDQSQILSIKYVMKYLCIAALQQSWSVFTGYLTLILSVPETVQISPINILEIVSVCARVICSIQMAIPRDNTQGCHTCCSDCKTR